MQDRKQDEGSADPILSPDQMCADGNLSRRTWYRHYRDKLPIIQLSPRRIGCRRSAWHAALEAQREQAA